MSLLDVTIVNVALPSMRSGLDTSAGTIQWVVSGYALAFGLTLVAGGRLGDAHGRRRLMLIGLTGFILSSAAAGLAPTAELVVVARLLQGASAGLLTPQSSGLIQQLFRGAERGKAFGFFGLTVSISAGIGPVLGGAIIAARRRGERLALAVPGQRADRPGRDGGDRTPGSRPVGDGRGARLPGRRTGGAAAGRGGAVPAVPAGESRGWRPASVAAGRRGTAVPVGVRALGAADPAARAPTAARCCAAARAARLRQRAGRRRPLLHRFHRRLPGAVGLPAGGHGPLAPAHRSAADPVRHGFGGHRSDRRPDRLRDRPPGHRRGTDRDDDRHPARRAARPRA